MIRNYLHTAIRNLLRRLSTSLMNISGLAIGMAVCTYIFLYVKFESGYDRYHKDYRRLYRIEQVVETGGARTHYAALSIKAGNAIKEFDEVEIMGRFGPWRSSEVSYKDVTYKEDVINYAEPELFRTLTIPVLQGDPYEGLKRPFTVVITREIANKYFGQDNPLGEVMRIDTIAFEVVAVLEDFRQDTHARGKIMFSAISVEPLIDMPPDVRSSNHLPTYIKLKEGVDPVRFGEKIIDIYTTRNLNGQWENQSNQKNTILLRPITDIHLRTPDLKWSYGTPGSLSFLTMISVTGFLVLVISGLNFMNLSTARYLKRSFEVGIRKTIGASRSDLIRQFIGESMVITLLAFVLSMFLLEFAMPFLNRISELDLTLRYLDPVLLFFQLSVILFIGLVAGSYPAFFLSSFHPLFVLRGGWENVRKGFFMRRLLVVVQFVISIALIISTLVVYKQLQYMKSQPLGFDIRQKLVFELPKGKVGRKNCESVKQEFLRHPAISAATVSTSVPGRWMYYWRLWPAGEQATNARQINCFEVDYDFIHVYGLEMVAGTPFDARLADSTNFNVLLNESAVKAFGWSTYEEALTKAIIDPREKVQGILRDYHFRGLQQAIEPLAIFPIHEDYRYMTLVMPQERVPELMEFTRKKFRELFPDAVFDYFFLDEDFDKQYRAEERTSRLVLIFTVLGVIIASLGLLGMTSFTLSNKRKEIGIRKVNGAGLYVLYFYLTKSYLKWIVAAYLVAVPIGWYASHLWLRDYAYRTSLSWWIFALAGLIALAIAMLTITYHTRKAARENPIQCLRYE